MSHNCAYVRQHYKVPAEIGRRVIAYGKPGVILADLGQYIGVVLDGDPKKRIGNYHPTHEMQYDENGRDAATQRVAGPTVQT
ncbi:hypothetical protein HNO85_12585 [Pseudomonas brassicacearum]|uniref:Uncharacterized protein n=1 Tax=Pseudomonas brassicacearum TaxID=930166 RepID=A0AAJ3FVN7_9PSED|nr:hypothetical protein [Pseudomonas brassicacearum]